MRSWPVLVALLCAITIEMMPLPAWMQPFRPPLPAMVLIYWVMMWPERFNLGFAFLLGICLDILHGQLLGQNALVLTVVTFITLRFHLQIRIFPLWQLTMTVFALLTLGAFLEFLIEGIAGLLPVGMSRWGRVLAGTALWAPVMGIMDRLRMTVEFRR